jgi:hypothetical protein
MIFEQSRVTLLHLLQERQEIAVARKKNLLGGLRESPNAMSHQSRPIEPQPLECEFAFGSSGMEATIGEQKQVI